MLQVDSIFRLFYHDRAT